jgi:hypothetical protein
MKQSEIRADDDVAPTFLRRDHVDRPHNLLPPAELMAAIERDDAIYNLRATIRRRERMQDATVDVAFIVSAFILLYFLAQYFAR